MSDICKQTPEEITALETKANAQGKKLKIEVIADSSGTFCGNGLRFDAAEQALKYAEDLSWRWTAVREYRVSIAED